MGAVEQTYRRDRTTVLSFVLLAGLGLLQATLGPVLPYLREELHLGYGLASLHISAFAAGALISGLVVPAVQRAIGRTAVAFACAVGAAAGAVLLTAARSGALTVTAAALMGLCLAAAYVAMWSMLSDHHGDRRTVVISEGEVAVALGNLALPLLVGIAAAIGAGWRAGLLTAAAALLVSVVLVSRAGLPPAAPESAARGAAPVRGIWLLVGVMVCVVGLESGVITWLASYLDDDVDLPRDAAVTLSASVSGAMLAGRLLASRLARRRGARALLIAALVTVVAGLPLLVTAGTLAAAVAGIVVAGLGLGAVSPLTQSLILAAAGPASTRASSASMLGAAIGVLVAPAAIGQLAGATSLRTALATALVLPLAALALLCGARLA
jgi:MFS family permease